ncbi:MAG TPA: sugar kinase [Bacteroidetes bacterium]|nr:sugar kinase [Bacteroidota bacterium]
MSLVVVGSVALDTVTTPAGKVEDALGGSALYFSAAASLLGPVSVVAVVGEDFPEDEIEFLKARGVDFRGLEKRPGKTFRWGGVYSEDLNQRETLFTHLNVFEDFSPSLPDAYRDAPFLFLANIHPRLQSQVLDQMRQLKFVAMDTMNFWIEGTPDELAAVLKRVQMLVINDSEARQLSGESQLLKAVRVIREKGPQTVVVKKGEHGALLAHGDSLFWAPAYPVENVVDPTGAGDTFAGGMMGYLARAGEVNETTLRRALMYGTALASFCVEDFSMRRLKTLTLEEVVQRLRTLREMTRFDLEE